MYIIMIGAPGTGKGTVGNILSKDMNLPHISTGDILRQHMANHTGLGKKIENDMVEGLLISDDIVIEIVKKRLMEDDAKAGAILDGFPRTITQARAFQEFLEKDMPEKKVSVIELKVPEEEIIKRIVNRINCPNKNCGEIYNLKTRPPKVEGICDICGSKLQKRDSDKEEIVKKRLEIYRADSKELLDFYEKSNLLYSIYPKDLDEAVQKIENHLKNIEGSN